MSTIIELKDVEKTFKTLNRREGLRGTFKDLFSKDYKLLTAVDHVSMKVEEGEMVGYLGPNGAGKSTTIKMMTGILEPTSGYISVNGKIPHKNRVLNSQDIGVVFGQRSQLWWALPVIESFKILKEIYRIDTTVYKNNLALFDSLVNISDLYSKPVRQMSLGQKTLCDILAAFLHNPKVVFLDEPTIGLDVSMKSKIRTLIHALNKEKNTTVILTTHDMGDVEALCKRILIIDKGAVIYDDHFDQLKGMFGSYRNLKLNVANSDYEQIKGDIISTFPEHGALTFEPDEEWLNILVNEDKVQLIKVLSYFIDKHDINDLKIEEIEAESVIKKIYEGGIA